MNRLILKFDVSDRYTYSYDQTLPIAYESAEKALVDFEQIVNKYLMWLDQMDKVGLGLEKIKDELAQKMRKLPDDKNKMKASHHNTISSWQEALQNSMRHEKEKSDNEVFEFGGQKLYFSNFLYCNENNDYEVMLPEIFTLDEFFKEVE